MVKRKHQHLLNVARSLRFLSKVPLHSWGKYLNTDVFLINRVLTPTLKEKSPYEILYQKLLQYEHFGVFGCLAYAVVPLQQRNKFSLRAIPTIFMDYPLGYKGYKFYDLSTKKLLFLEMCIYLKVISLSTTHNLTLHPIPLLIWSFPKPSPSLPPRLKLTLCLKLSQ